MWVVMDGLNEWINVKEDYPLLLINSRLIDWWNDEFLGWKKKVNENICSTSQKIPNVKYEEGDFLRIAFEFDNSGAIKVKDRFIPLT